MTLTYRFARSVAWLSFKALGRTRVIGHERIPTSGPVIVASNHVSYADPPLVGSSIRRECAFMARHDLFKAPLLGAMISRLNAFPVHRDTADRAALREAVNVLQRGMVLVLFPEGTRSPDGRLQPAQPGLALIVKRSKAPVVPCAVVGPELMWPVGARCARPARLTVIFGEPIEFSQSSTRDEILSGTMQAIANLLESYRPQLPPGTNYLSVD